MSLTRYQLPAFREFEPGQIIGTVRTLAPKTHRDSYECAAWSRDHEAAPQIVPLKLGFDFYGCTFTAPLRATATLSSRITAACLVSLFGGVAYGRDNAGEREVGKAAEFSISLPLSALFNYGGKFDDCETRIFPELRAKLRAFALSDEDTHAAYVMQCIADQRAEAADGPRTPDNWGMVAHYAPDLQRIAARLSEMHRDAGHEREGKCAYCPKWCATEYAPHVLPA